MKLTSLNSLRAFEACARTGSVQKAAEQLHVTPSAVSHQLKKLEDELGVVLLQRSHRKITVTEKGQLLQQTLNKAFGLIANTLDSLQEKDSRELAINVVPVFSIKWLSPRLLRFFNRHPQVDLTLKNSYHMEDLSSRKCDLAIRWGDGNWPDVHSIKLFEEMAIPVLSPQLAQQNKVETAEDVLQLPLIQLFEGAEHWQLWAKWHGVVLPDNARYLKYNDPAAALQAAIDGLGVALGPVSLVFDDIRQGRLRHIGRQLIPSGRSYYVSLPHQSDLNSSKVAAFVGWLEQEAQAFQQDVNSLFE